MEPHVGCGFRVAAVVDASTAAVKAHVSRERAPAPGVDNGWRSSAQMYLTPREDRLTMTQALCRYYGYPATTINIPPPRRSGIERHCSSVASAWQKRCACFERKSSSNFGEYRRFLSYNPIPSRDAAAPSRDALLRVAMPLLRVATPRLPSRDASSRGRDSSSPSRDASTPETRRPDSETRRPDSETRRLDCRVATHDSRASPRDSRLSS